MKSFYGITIPELPENLIKINNASMVFGQTGAYIGNVGLNTGEIIFDGGMNLQEEIMKIKEMIAPDLVVIKCQACGQWGARGCVCKFCGSPIE